METCTKSGYKSRFLILNKIPLIFVIFLDTVLVSDSKDGLLELVTAAKIESEKAGLGMNVKKTKTMVVTKQDENIRANIKIDNKTLEQVNFLKYLGQTITPDGRN